MRILMLLLLPGLVWATPVDLSWTLYDDTNLPPDITYDPADYQIEAECRVDSGQFSQVGVVPATETSFSGDVTAGPGDVIGCVIRATRLSDGLSSAYSLEDSKTVPLGDPGVPLDLQLSLP